MTEIKIKLFSRNSLASPRFAEKVYSIFDSWDFPPTKFHPYEPIRTPWEDRSQFGHFWQTESSGYFGMVIMRRMKSPRYFANPTFQFGPKAGYHGFSVYGIKEKECPEPVLNKFLDLAETLFLELDMDYGFMCLDEEYHAKNIIKNYRHSNGANEPNKVAGMNWPKYLPGFYWMNFYGISYLEKGFGAKLYENKEFSGNVKRLPTGIRVQAGQSLRTFQTDEGLNRERKMKVLLGETWFFNQKEESNYDAIDSSAELRHPKASKGSATVLK